MAIFSGVGRLISFKYKSTEESGLKDSLLELSITIPTGEKKKEGVDYAPSNIWKTTLWGNAAEGLKDRVYVIEGQSKQRLEVTGEVGVPDSYLKSDGTAGTGLKLVNARVQIIDWKPETDEVEEAESAPVVTEKAKTTTKKAAKKDELLEAVAPDFSDLDEIE